MLNYMSSETASKYLTAETIVDALEESIDGWEIEHFGRKRKRKIRLLELEYEYLLARSNRIENQSGNHFNLIKIEGEKELSYVLALEGLKASGDYYKDWARVGMKIAHEKYFGEGKRTGRPKSKTANIKIERARAIDRILKYTVNESQNYSIDQKWCNKLTVKLIVRAFREHLGKEKNEDVLDALQVADHVLKFSSGDVDSVCKSVSTGRGILRAIELERLRPRNPLAKYLEYF